MAHREDEENKIETVDSVEDRGNVKMSQAGKGQETATREPDSWETDCQGCKGKDTVCKVGRGLWCTKCGMGNQEPTQSQGKQMNGEGKVSHERVTSEATKEAVAQGEVSGIDTLECDQGNSEKAKVAMARAERKKAKAQEKERKRLKNIEKSIVEDEKLREEREACDGTATINKIRAEHGPFPSRSLKIG